MTIFFLQVLQKKNTSMSITTPRIHGGDIENAGELFRKLLVLQKNLEDGEINNTPMTARDGLIIMDTCEQVGKVACTPGVDCEDEKLNNLKSRGTKLARDTYNEQMKYGIITKTRDGKSEEVQRCVSKDFKIMGSDLPEDEEQMRQVKKLLNIIAKESKNISQIAKWTQEIGKSLDAKCDIVDKMYGDKDTKTNNELRMRTCGETTHCQWLPTAKDGENDMDKTTKGAEGKCVAGIDDLARQLRGEAEKIQNLTKKTQANPDDTAETAYKEFLKENGMMVGDDVVSESGKVFIHSKTWRPTLAATKMPQRIKKDLWKLYSAYQSEKSAKDELTISKGRINKDGTDGDPLFKEVKQRYVNSKTYEDLDARCHTSGLDHGATWHDCATTTLDPDKRYKDPNTMRVCGVVDHATGELTKYKKDDHEKKKMSENDQCRYVAGRGVTWSSKKEGRDYITKSIRSDLTEREFAKMMLNIDSEKKNPTHAEVDEQEAAIKKKIADQKHQLKKITVTDEEKLSSSSNDI